MDSNELQAAYTAALRDGDEPAARALVERARAAGLTPDEIYLTVFAPSMITIGELWERNELSVAEEHLATAITERLVGELSSWFEQAGRPPVGSMVLGCVEGENHALGLRMLADIFRQHGWRVLYLGANVPTADWVKLAVRAGVDAAAISVNAQRYLLNARTLIAELRSARPGLSILVGGAAFDRNPELWRTVGADIYQRDPGAAVAQLTARHMAAAHQPEVQRENV